jgi:2-methylcitrate dehydratase PrpD
MTKVEASSPNGATFNLARFVHGADFGDLPESARHASRRAFVNIVGCCLGGARHEIVEVAAKTLLPFAGEASASLLGRPERTDMLTATLLNALSSAAYSFDDTHADTILHPSGTVAATLLAIAERQPMRGQDFLLAFTLGVEVAARVSKAVSVKPAAGNIGWSQSGIAAGIGAAAAAAKALRLEPRGIAEAIAIAASEASGLRVTHGTMAATMIFGNAAHSGLRSALLARQGLSAPTSALEGQHGFAMLFASHPHLPYLDHALGDRFEVELLGYKPYPCGVVAHPSVDAALEFHRTAKSEDGELIGARLQVHPSALALGDRRHPTNVLEAKVSLYHWAAVALERGQAGIREGQQDAIDAPAIRHLRDLIVAESDPSLAPEAAILTVRFAGGRQVQRSVNHCRGSLANPMSDADLAEKFLGQAGLHLAPAQAAEALAACWRIDALPNAAHVVGLCRAK